MSEKFKAIILDNQKRSTYFQMLKTNKKISLIDGKQVKVGYAVLDIKEQAPQFKKSNMTILVTGSSGFIGSNLVKYLQKKKMIF